MTTDQAPDDVTTMAEADTASTLSGPPAPLPTLTTPLAPDQVIARLLALAKRGKLPEFHAIEAGATPDRRDFRVLAFGSPYDRDLFGEIRRSGAGSTITFRSRLKRKMPTITIATMAVSLWPGVWLTDSMLSTYFSWYPRNAWITVAWYIPLTLAAVPMLIKQYRKSEILTHAESHMVVEKIAAAIDAK